MLFVYVLTQRTLFSVKSIAEKFAAIRWENKLQLEVLKKFSGIGFVLTESMKQKYQKSSSLIVIELGN